MDIKQIEELMECMQQAGLKRLALREEGFEIELEAHSSDQASWGTPQVLHQAGAPAPAAEPAVEEDRQYITSPMVGTFYAASSPDDDPFITAGNSVNAESVVCIIEAMKVMNEVKAGTSGTIVEVLVKNGDPVEFGTKIFAIK